MLILDQFTGTGKGNNYAYLVTDEPTKQSVIIDPANPPEWVASLERVETTWAELIMWNYRVAPELKSQIASGKIDLTAIVNTHQYVDRTFMRW